MKLAGCLAAAQVALLAFALSVTGDAVLPAGAQEKKVVRIVTARAVNFVALWGMGPFAEKYGLRTEMSDTNTNAEMQRYVQTGAVQVASLGYATPAIMAEQNISTVKIIAGIYLGGQNLIIRKGVDFRSWKDLEGKRIGRPPGTYVAILFTLAAEANNVDLSKVNIVNTTAAGTAELQALRNGDLDGLVMFSPTPDRAVVDGYAVYPPCCNISSTAKFGGHNQILGANADFLKDRALAVNFLKAFVEAQEFFHRNPDKAVEVIGQYTGVGKDVIAEARKHADLEVRVDVETAVNVAKEGPKFGFTKADMSGKVRDYFDLSYLSEATGKPVEQLSSFKK
jgi:ABC-type nitrate/sulfonate/bicarbonate transport system substrate-binding protein